MDVIGSEEDYEVMEEEEETSDPPKPLSDCFEALAGAVFIDSNMSLQQVWSVFFPFLKPLIGKSYEQYLCILQPCHYILCLAL